jgi:pimeloyl-ACP methyl ester carboxylesterase
MDREILLLLHGALGASTQFTPLIPLLEEPFEVHTLDLEGHGTSPLKDRPFRLNHFAENVIEYLDNHALDKANIFGHSMGGHTGLCLARFFPGRVKGVFTFFFNPEWFSLLGEVPCLFSRGYLFEIPLRFAMTKYFGCIPVDA